MKTDFPSSQLKEGHSTQQPPLFDGLNYNFWKCRMKIYLQSINYELRNIVKATYENPPTNYDQWSEEQKKLVNLDTKAMNSFFCALNKEKFNRVSIATTAHQIWQILQVTHKEKDLKFLFLFTCLNYSR